ncbi:hypothetical protein PoB_007627300 [Plakobranchus ocellatus]|uniref:Uncharacterized protein n=1 Tax=Plakobranchus ocellatus TaxID=259542 RepID=A0AAV4DZJ3_9GAST|nr:hypothetical protein PoB_007627300 [Plakobranchus ocellatus]
MEDRPVIKIELIVHERKGKKDTLASNPEVMATSLSLLKTATTAITSPKSSCLSSLMRSSRCAGLRCCFLLLKPWRLMACQLALPEA